MLAANVVSVGKYPPLPSHPSADPRAQSPLVNPCYVSPGDLRLTGSEGAMSRSELTCPPRWEEWEDVQSQWSTFIKMYTEGTGRSSMATHILTDAWFMRSSWYRSSSVLICQKADKVQKQWWAEGPNPPPRDLQKFEKFNRERISPSSYQHEYFLRQRQD